MKISKGSLRNFLIPFLITTVIVVLFYWILIDWYDPIGLYLSFMIIPLFLAVILILFTGILAIPIAIYFQIKRKGLPNFIIITVGIIAGFAVGMVLSSPIHTWDREQRNRSGMIISEYIEDYKSTHGFYPELLEDLDLEEIDENLPRNYKSNRFLYLSNQKEYQLIILIPIFDRWVWNPETREFDYKDF